MAVAAWSANDTVAFGAIKRANNTLYNGFFFKCTTAGTTGSSEPDWPRHLGKTITDNSAVWIVISSIYADLSVLSPSAIIELFELHLNSTLHNSNNIIRWHNGCNANITGNIVFGTQSYTRMAIQATGFKKSTSGTLARPTLTVANTDQLMTFLLRDVNLFNSGNDLGGAVVKRLQTCKKFLDGESTADFYAQYPVESFEIDRKSSENKNTVSFELVTVVDKPNEYIPKRQLLGNCCQWQYRSSECSYTGSNYFDKDDNVVNTLAADVCGKRLSSCKKRFGENGVLPFGSFPTAGKTQ